MKKLLCSAAPFVLALSAAHADDVALMQIRIGKDKTLRPVAIEFYETDAPRTVENFKKLARKSFYKGIAFHRVFPHILVQAGDPLSRKKDRTKVGTGGPGFTILPEIRRKHTKGSVAAARLPDKINPSRVSNGSQFFVNLQPAPNYNGQYTVFGNVIYGLDTLDFISTKPVDSNDNPIERSVIRSVKILPREKLPPAPAPVVPVSKPAKRWWQIFG
jgi:cyclophilin family peptidyl-prolyl cis-trans isomerase